MNGAGAIHRAQAPVVWGGFVHRVTVAISYLRVVLEIT